MAKSTEMTVEEKLKTLYQLQVTLSGIDEKRALRGELPLEVQDLEDEIAGLNTRLGKIQGEIEDFQNAVAQKRMEIQQAQESVERYKVQLDDVRNNREYDTLTKEIEFQNLEIELCNKKIREANQKVTERQEDLEATQKTIDERSADLEHKRSELQEVMEETREDEEKLKAKAKDLEAKMSTADARLLNSFKRIRKGARNGLGIVPIYHAACGGCFSKIPPQRQLDLKMHKKIIVCEYCGRILVDPELAGIKTEAPAEEKKTRKRSGTRTRAKKAAVPAEETPEAPEA